MMRSMFSGVSGLRVHQTKMDVIANNIANVNTVGYKASRVTFNEVFSQTLSGASAATPETGRGGKNAMQIGLGANVASIDLLMTTGASQRTDNPYDLMIEGDGFFVVEDGSGTYFTRAGAFRLDESGNLTMPNGMGVCGWKAVLDTNINSPTYGQNIIQKGNATPIQITGSDEYVVPKASSSIEYNGNIDSRDVLTDKESTIQIFDSLGNSYTINVRLHYDTGSKSYQVQLGNFMYPEDADKETGGIYIGGQTPGAITANGVVDVTVVPAATPAATKFAYGPVIGTIKFTDKGYVDTAAAAASLLNFNLKLDPAATAAIIDPKCTFADAVNVNMANLTQFAQTTDAVAKTKDGNKPGKLREFSIAANGDVTGTYTNGQTKLLAKIVIAKFKNPAGLQKAGNNLYTQTRNSGEYDGVGSDPTDGGSSLLSGVLEMSNVDLSSEFTEMITTQRGFQANSRVITTSDELLQELVNLKR